MWKDYSLVNFLKGRSLVQLMIFIFIILCVTNFIIFQLGFEGVTQKKAIISRSFFPKGYVIGLIWTILVILQTISFKKISSQINSFLILILIMNCIMYPIYTLGFSIFSIILIGNLITIGLSAFISGSVFLESKLFSLFIGLTTVWVIYVTFLMTLVHI